jgi:hypothetical protein
MIIGIIEMLNGLAHITVAIIKWNYFPGCITAFSLIIFGLMVFIYYSSHEYKKIPG